MLKHLKYLRYVLRHKRLVYREGRKLGLSRRTLLAHDLSKFSRAEWGAYVAKFYDPIAVGTRVEVNYDNTGDDATVIEIRESDDARYKVRVDKGEEFWAWDYEVSRPAVDKAFNVAWKHHYRNNPHHWNYWVETYDEWTGALDRPRAREMPDEYRREMLADWRAMGYGTKGYDDSREFYLKTGGGMVLHPQTRAWVEEQLGIEEIVYAVA